jgi:hypothetical protein
LAFKATTPCVEVTLVSENQGVMLSTGDLNNTLVTKRLQNLRFLSGSRTSVSSSTESANTMAKNITITGQV